MREQQLTANHSKHSDTRKQLTINITKYQKP